MNATLRRPMAGRPATMLAPPKTLARSRLRLAPPCGAANLAGNVVSIGFPLVG